MFCIRSAELDFFIFNKNIVFRSGFLHWAPPSENYRTAVSSPPDLSTWEDWYGVLFDNGWKLVVGTPETSKWQKVMADVKDPVRQTFAHGLKQSGFSRTRKSGNIGIIANFVLSYISNLLLYLHHIMSVNTVADLRGARGCTPPRGPKFFQFHAVFGKCWQNRMLAPPGELAPPPWGNPGSATVNVKLNVSE